MLQEDLKSTVVILVEEKQFPNINVKLLDNNLSKMFAISIVSQNNFCEYPQLLCQAIGVFI